MPVATQVGWISTHAERLEVADCDDTQETLDETPEESFLDSVVLLSITEVAQDMGVGNGALPIPP